MEKDIDREKFKEKKRAELEALYDAVNEETLMIAEDPEKFSAYLRIEIQQIHGDECDPFAASVSGCTEAQNI